MSESTKNKSLYHIAPLTEKNFTMWKFRMQHILQDRGLWKCIETVDPSLSSSSKPPKPPSVEEEQKAIAQIVLCLSDEITPLVQRLNATTAKEIWSALIKQFEQKGLSSRVYLRRRLLNIKYKVGDTMQAHLNRISDLSNQLEAVGAGFSDSDLALITLCSLPDEYESFIVQVEARPLKEVTFEYVTSRLLSEAARREMHDREIFEQKRLSMEGPDIGQQRSFSARVKDVCSHCGRAGHIEKNCWDKYPEQRAKNKKNVIAATAVVSENAF